MSEIIHFFSSQNGLKFNKNYVWNVLVYKNQLMKKKLFCVYVDTNLWIDPHGGHGQAVFYYCNTAETVYDGTVELSFTLVYSLDSLILAD